MALLKRPERKQLSPREALERRYNATRRNILILIVFTLFNMLLILTRSGLYFLFSAHIPYVLVETGMLFCGMLPEDVYKTLYEEPYHTIDFVDKGFFYLMLLAGAFMMVWYLISWMRTKKEISMGWLIFTLIYIAVDTVVMAIVPGSYATGIFNYVFHGLLSLSLISGIIAAYKLKSMPPEEMEAEE